MATSAPLPLEVAYAGAHIREWREDKDWSQEDLAARAHCDPSTVRRIESGRKNYSVRYLVPVLKALGKLPKPLFEEIAISPRRRGRPRVRNERS